MKMKNQGLFLLMVLMIFFSIQISLASVAVNRTSVPGNTVEYVSQLAEGLPKDSKILFLRQRKHTSFVLDIKEAVHAKWAS